MYSLYRETRLMFIGSLEQVLQVPEILKLQLLITLYNVAPQQFFYSAHRSAVCFLNVI